MLTSDQIEEAMTQGLALIKMARGLRGPRVVSVRSFIIDGRRFRFAVGMAEENPLSLLEAVKGSGGSTVADSDGDDGA